jgi:hypothetical protein
MVLLIEGAQTGPLTFNKEVKMSVISSKLNIDPGSAYVLASNVIGNQVIRELKAIGFKPRRIQPKSTAKIPGKARLVVVVPKAVSHGASDTAQRWSRKNTTNILVMANSGAGLRDKLIERGIVSNVVEEVTDPVFSIDPRKHNRIYKYIDALILKDNSITLSRFRAAVIHHGLGDEPGYVGYNYHKRVGVFREINGYPSFGKGSKGAPRPANWMPDEETPALVENVAKLPTKIADKATEVEPKPASIQTQPTPPVASETSPEGYARDVADLVWGWMDEMGYERVRFDSNGCVSVKHVTKPARNFSFETVNAIVTLTDDD